MKKDKDNENVKFFDEAEEMTVSLFENGKEIVCAVMSIYEMRGKDYIAVQPVDEAELGTIWVYGYSENPKDTNEEPVLRDLDDEEYDEALDKFYEYLDKQEYDEIIETEEDEDE